MPALLNRFIPVSAALLIAGCLDHPLKDVEYEKSSVDGESVQVAINKDVDILFVIDNSGSMAEEQALLSANFGSFINVLEQDTVRANYRIGVTTTDAGNPRCNTTTPEIGHLVLSSCVDRVDDGEFMANDEDFSFACNDFCDKTDEDLRIKPTTIEAGGAAAPRKWLESIEGEINVEGVDSMVEAFQCYGPQGVAGCGFESHLESMYLALAGAKDKNSKHNYGFLRERAILSVVFITDEADCSHNPAAKDIFTTNKVFWDDPINDPAPTSAACWNAGVACTGDGTFDECHAENYDLAGNPGADDADAVLQPVSKYVDFLQNIEDNKKRFDGSQEVLVSLIAGVPIGYDTNDAEIPYADAADPMYQSLFGVGPGCIIGDANSPDSTAVPPVREREFAEAFEVGDARNLYSICQDDYSAALGSIADKLIQQIKPACMTRCVKDLDLTTEIAEPNCELADVDTVSGARTPIPACIETKDGWTAPANAAACYAYLVDTDGAQTPSKLDDMSSQCVDEGFNLEFYLMRSKAAPAGSTVSATCELSDNRDRDCPNL
jgi:hypothetical protein